MNTLKKVLFLCVIALGLTIGIQPFSYATPLQIFLSDGINSAIVNDGGIGDTSPLVDGVITFNAPIGNWTVNVTTAITYPAIGSPSTPQIDFNSVDVSSQSGTLILGVSALGFTFAPGAVTFQIGGTTAGTVEALAFSGNNSFFDLSNPIGGLLSFTPGAFSGSTSGSIPASPNPYSLAMLVEIDHDGPGVTSFNGNIAVPEPATMLLLGSGLLGMGIFVRRRFKK